MYFLIHTCLKLEAKMFLYFCALCMRDDPREHIDYPSQWNMIHNGIRTINLLTSHGWAIEGIEDDWFFVLSFEGNSASRTGLDLAGRVCSWDFYLCPFYFSFFLSIHSILLSLDLLSTTSSLLSQSLKYSVWLCDRCNQCSPRSNSSLLWVSHFHALPWR